MKATATGRRFYPHLSTYLVLVAGILVSLAAFRVVRTSETRALETEFGRRASVRSMALERNLRTYADVVVALATLNHSPGGIDRDEFSLLATPLIQHHPGIRALEWIPRVPGPRRRIIEKRTREEGFPGFRIVEFSGDGPVPRSEQDEYYPVLYVEPFEGNEPAMGFDIASDETRRRAMTEARDTGRAVATAPLRLVQGRNGVLGFLILLPVYDPYRPNLTVSERRKHLQGFVLGVYDTREVMDATLSGFTSEGLEIRLTDLTGDPEERLFGIWDGATRHYRIDETGTPARPGFDMENEFQLAGRHWKISVDALPSFFEDKPSGLSYAVLIGGFLLSLVSGAFLYRSTDRARRLLESESRYRAMVQSTPDAIVVFDPWENRFIDANENALRLFKCSREELMRLGPVDVSPELQPDGKSSREEALERVGKALSGGGRSFEWIHRDTKGREFPAEVRLARFPSSTRKNLLLGSITDITVRRKEAEERRILEKRLLEAQKLESLGLLTSGIAHDFNNLLTPIMGRAGLALDEIPKDSPGRIHVEDIRISAKRAEEIIRQLLAFTGQATIEPVKIALNAVAREMGHLWEVSLPPGTHLEFVLCDGDPVVEGDAGQIRQAVLNLITNAADAVGESGGTIRVATGSSDLTRQDLEQFMGGTELDEGEYAWIEVADTGPGLDVQTEGRIFEPFFTTKERGRGLGLASVLGIVRTHQGAIRVSSRPGAGTTFRVAIPRTGGPVDETEINLPRPPTWATHGTVLIVDDEERIRTLIAAVLAREGIRCVLAADGFEAIRKYDEHREDIRLVVADHSMPGLSGVDVFRKIRERDPAIPVILMSGFGERTMVSQVSGEGLTAFLQKPFDPRRLLDAVQRALEPV